MDTLLSRLQELLERTMELAGSCAHLHMKLGFMHMQRWRGSGVGPLAEMQFALALSIDREASEVSSSFNLHENIERTNSHLL